MRLVFSRRWIGLTLLVVAAAGVMVRLGIWQLDRLDQRRQLNARVEAQINAQPFDLNAALADGSMPDLVNMEYRTVTASGVFDPSNEVALHNQVFENQVGVHLLTPLRLAGTDQSIIVDRGWIPLEDYQAGRASDYGEAGEVMISGRLLRSVETGTIWRKVDPTAAPGERLESLIYPNLSRISAQSSYPLLPVYIQAAPGADHAGLPIRFEEPIVLSEGSHMGYALQWFGFAITLLAGYPFFVRRTEIQHHTNRADAPGSSLRTSERHHEA